MFARLRAKLPDKKALAEKTIKNVRATLRRILASAKEWGEIPAIPDLPRVKVPFLKRKEDVAAVFQALPRPINIVYALGALAGLRPGEAVALEWEAVDFDAGLILVRRQLREGRLGVPKSGKEREVPIVPSLSVVLKAWRRKNPKAELVAPSLRKSKSGKTKFLNWRTIKNAMKQALKKCGLRPMTFYQAGRHTFASQWVLSGNSIYRLKEIMGHSSVQVTERYAHLTNQLTAAELAQADVRLAS